jgi:GNAT superfamily N-acetyltransferase
MTVEVPQGTRALEEFVRFHDRVYATRSARWLAPVDLLLPILTGESPFARGREIRPFWAIDRGDVVARAVAVVDPRYQRHWNEQLGHVVWFEALPSADETARSVLDEACAWLEARGAVAARSGMGLLDLPFAMDAYDALPPSLLRQNAEHYHLSLKRARFEVEQGWVDYKITVTPELIDRWQRALDGARQAGYAIVPARDVTRARRVSEITDTWADTFKAHLGWSALTEDEVAHLLDGFEAQGVLDTSVLAYAGDDAVGMCLVAADDLHHAAVAPGRTIADGERLNFLAIGVRERARGRGINYAMAAYGLLELARRGRTHVSYTLVLDDNWPSRRTGEGLGATVCANYLTYRRNFRQATTISKARR